VHQEGEVVVALVELLEVDLLREEAAEGLQEVVLVQGEAEPGEVAEDLAVEVVEVEVEVVEVVGVRVAEAEDIRESERHCNESPKISISNDNLLTHISHRARAVSTVTKH